MEERRILKSDVQRVIEHAERTGMKLFNPDSGRSRASFRPGHVTYWVEYSPIACPGVPVSGGFIIHNAWCHRMEIME